MTETSWDTALEDPLTNYEYPSNKLLAEKLSHLENFYQATFGLDVFNDIKRKVAIDWETFYSTLISYCRTGYWIEGEEVRNRSNTWFDDNSIWFNGYLNLSVIGVLFFLVAADYLRYFALPGLVIYLFLVAGNYIALFFASIEDDTKNLRRQMLKLEQNIYQSKLREFGYVADYELRQFCKYYSFLPDATEEEERRGFIFALSMAVVKIKALSSYTSADYFSSREYLSNTRLNWKELGVSSI
jgi:hypothetical protein